MGFFDQGGQQYDPNMPTTTPDSIPAGDYEADIKEVELKPTKDGRGEYVKLRHDIIGPSHQGRVIFANINISNPSQAAESIGRQQLNELQGATGVYALRAPQDLQQFAGRRVIIKVSRKEDKEYGDSQGYKNEIKGWKAMAGSQMPQTSPSQTVPTQSAPQQQSQLPGVGTSQPGNNPPW
ncbi:MAG: DUF669 domain-containing protein [Advenella sp.]